MYSYAPCRTVLGTRYSERYTQRTRWSRLLSTKRRDNSDIYLDTVIRSRGIPRQKNTGIRFSGIRDRKKYPENTVIVLERPVLNKIPTVLLSTTVSITAYHIIRLIVPANNLFPLDSACALSACLFFVSQLFFYFFLFFFFVTFLFALLRPRC